MTKVLQLSTSAHGWGEPGSDELCNSITPIIHRTSEWWVILIDDPTLLRDPYVLLFFFLLTLDDTTIRYEITISVPGYKFWIFIKGFDFHPVWLWRVIILQSYLVQYIYDCVITCRDCIWSDVLNHWIEVLSYIKYNIS